MAENITSQQIKDINSASVYSAACDESKDVSDIEQIELLCRYVNSAGPQEEIIELIPLQGQTQGEEICEVVLDCLKTKEINANHLVSVTTDEAPSMTGAHKGFVTLLQKSQDRKLLTFHCILHQKGFVCSSVSSSCHSDSEQNNGKRIKPQTVLFIIEEVENAYSDLLLHNKVWWLSRGEVLKCIAVCLESKGLTFPELEQPDWLEKLHFLVDTTVHLDMLNKSLKGKGGTALQMLEEVLVFEHKMTVFARDVQRVMLSLFPSLRESKEAHNQENYENLQRAIIAMQTAFGKRFCNFREEKNLILSCHAPDH